ncbi:MAG: ribosome maturation factor RimP [Pseudomonadota bacterium]|nr:ribosome maturation factor RimP [Alphaproteobacteria bacterium]MEC7702814.1 ribosome maturation factor RimP [Pseudomonadota bacterium]MEC9235399.1 ribosome maturation factor RimP [Pseudomonadota bacterium]
MKQTPQERKITEIITPVVEEQGFAIVQVKLSGKETGYTLQIMAEDPNTGRLGIDDCTKLSHSISDILDVEDPINGQYNLEISSPGIDRPLINDADYLRFKGFECKVELAIPSEIGQRRFRGFIAGCDDGIVTLDTDQGSIEFDVGNVSKAKLILNDKLIEATKNGLPKLAEA